MTAHSILIDEESSASPATSAADLEKRRSIPPRGKNAGTRKKLVRREGKDFSQRIRLAVQSVLLALNAWIGLQFYLWVRWAETGGQSIPVSRPPGVEGWLPIEGMMQFKYVLASGRLPRVHPAAFFLFLAFALSSFLFRKSFCGWLCPVGTVSEYLWKLGRWIFGRNFGLPRWVDLPLRSLKYVLLGFFLYAVTMMSAAAIADFVASPYGLVVDVRMLNFFRFAGMTTAYVLVVAGVVVSSRAELLVPLSLPLRRFDGADLAVQPNAHYPHGECLH